uniref:acireductone dioxygenase (Fe(2+)-requiring) n=1 Tax=Ditylenchus dipsaci TaxID=166011 RepID=A0A915DWZ1_9BILA
MVVCWLMCEPVVDQKAECHREPPQYVTEEEMASFGVICYQVPVNDGGEGLKEFVKKQGYQCSNEIVIHPSTIPNFEEECKNFFAEHSHTEEGVRYFAEGEGYFDVRNDKGEWVRILCRPGDVITLPSNIYHRFTTTNTDSVVLVRLFKEEPSYKINIRGGATVDHFYNRKDVITT